MRVLALLTMVLASGCGSGPSAPAPAQPVQAAGVWRGSMLVMSGTGEPCVGSAFQSAAGVRFDYMLTIEQQGDRLTASSRSVATGIVCRLTGTAGSSSITLNMASCEVPEPRFFSCSETVFRGARPSALAINATITGNSASASYLETYNVFDWNTATNLGTASINAQLTLTR